VVGACFILDLAPGECQRMGEDVDVEAAWDGAKLSNLYVHVPGVKPT
jgi:hypothetical protein